MTVIIIILIILIIPAILATFLPNEYVIEREIIINKPLQFVFDYIKLVKNSAYYSKWVMLDPAMKKDFKGVDGTTGFVYYWDSEMKQVGKGEQEITSVREGDRIDYEIRFIKPFQSVSTSYMSTQAVSPQRTKVTWVFKGLRNYPMKLMHMLLNLKKMLGRDLATGLENLKQVLEK